MSNAMQQLRELRHSARPCQQPHAGNQGWEQSGKVPEHFLPALRGQRVPHAVHLPGTQTALWDPRMLQPTWRIPTRPTAILGYMQSEHLMLTPTPSPISPSDNSRASTNQCLQQGWHWEGWEGTLLLRNQSVDAVIAANWRGADRTEPNFALGALHGAGTHTSPVQSLPCWMPYVFLMVILIAVISF